MTSAAAASVAGLSAIGTAAAAERHGMSFDRVVDAVDDLGADPTGGQRVDGIIDREATDGTLIVFPEGEYRFGSARRLDDRGTIGLVGEGDVRFVAPQGINGHLLKCVTDRLLFKDIDVDQRTEDTTTGIDAHTQRGFHIENVEFLGRGLHSEFTSRHDTNDRITQYMGLSVANADATGTIKNFVVTEGDAWSHYRGATGIYVGARNEGTIRVVDCQIEECGGDGIYASRHTGNIQVEGGLFRNNNVASVRISGEGSYVDGARVEVDPAVYSGPRTREDSAFNMRGIVIEQKTQQQSRTKPPGVEVRNCDIVIKENPTNGPGISAWSNGKTLAVRDTRIQMDNDAPAIDREGQSYQGNNPPSDTPRWLRCENVSITGSADGGAAVRIRDAPNSWLRNCCIQQTGTDRDGVRIAGSDGTEVSSTTINTTGRALNVDGSNVSTSAITRSGTCPVPGSGETPDGGTTLENTLRIESGDTGTLATYEATVSGEIQKGVDANSSDTVSGSTATGGVNGGQDTFVFSGELTDLSVDGDATVYVNGDPVDPATVGSSDGGGSTTEPTSRELRLEGTGTQTEYEFSVSDGIEPGDDIESWDDVSGTTANGWITYQGTADTFSITGEITDFTFLEGEANVYLDGEQVDHTQLGSDSSGDTGDPSGGTDGGTTLENTLRIESGDTGTLATYEATVSGEIEKGDRANSGDTVSGSTATGGVNGGQDTFVFSGELTDLSVDGDATVYVNGDPVDPDQVGVDLPNLLTIDGRDTDLTSYTIAVDGDIVKGENANSEDTVSGSTATGTVDDAVDDYQFSGDIVNMEIDGKAAVTFGVDGN